MLSIRSVGKLLFNFGRNVKSIKPFNNDSIQAQTEVQEVQGTTQELDEISQEFESLSPENLEIHKQRARAAVLKDLSYEGEDPSPNKLVNRPAQGATWGLGGQLVLAQRKV